MRTLQHCLKLLITSYKATHFLGAVHMIGIAKWVAMFPLRLSTFYSCKIAVKSC